MKNNNQLISNILSTNEFFWRSMAVEVYDKNVLFAWATNLRFSHLNGVTSKKAKITVKNIKEVIHFFETKNVPFLWNLNPICDPEKAVELLLSQGFKETGSYSVMWYDLTKELPELDLSKCCIKEALNEYDLREWKIPLDEGFKTDMNEQFGYFDRVKNIPYGKVEAFHHYVAYYDKKPVSCATLSFSKYGARIDNVATCDDFLRQGFGSSVTIFAMIEAKKIGCKMVCLEASDAGLSLYLKIGFKEIYKNIEYAIG
jgi:GNAT superfamily N-acetyltransferase